MNIHNSEGALIDTEDDFESLVATFLCQAKTNDEIQFTLNLLNIGISSLSDKCLEITRDFIRWDPSVSAETKMLAVSIIDGQLALRELAAA